MAIPREDSLKAHWKCLLACTLVSMCPFQYGVDFGVIGGLQAMPGFLQVFGNKDPNSPIGYNISPTSQQLISSLMILGAFLASAATGFIATYVGRKGSLWIACALTFLSNIIMMTTKTIAGLCIGRLINGLANGLFMTFSQLYLQECSPRKYRGLTIGALQTWISIGTVVGTIIDNFTVPLGGKKAYIVPLGVIYILPGLMAIGLFFIPESPRWLLQVGKEEKSRQSLVWLRPFPETVGHELAEMKAAMDAEKHLAQNAALVDLWKNPIDRRRTALAILPLLVQASTGAMYIISYGTYFFEMAHVGKPFQNAVILTTCGVAVIILNSCIITKYGRRRVFLITGLIICAISQLIIAIVYTVKPNTESTGKVIVGMSILYIIGFNGFVPTYAWLCAGEIPSQRLRSYTFGFASALGFFGAWLTTFTAPYFINTSALNWGPKYGYIWVPSCLISACWVWFFLPEVMNRSFEEIDEMFMAKLPARKFRKYKCIGLGNPTPATPVEDEKEPRVSMDEVAGSEKKAASKE